MSTYLGRTYSLGAVAGFLGILLLSGAGVAHASAATAPTTAASIVASEQISLLWSLPFVLLLACIALMPFIHKHWWEKYYPVVAVSLGAIAAYYYFALAPSPKRWLEEMESYISFIVLLGSLFAVSGGIVIHVNRKATPLANCVMLALGAIAANFFGTTGASMLLIRPYLRMNKGHIKPYHVVFFIFAVSNA
ncbi:MAG: sodium:proton antiporter, partial [Bacillota bacterium]